MNRLASMLSGEFFLNGRPNGGTAIILRTIYVTILIYSFALVLKTTTNEGATLIFSIDQLLRDVNETIPWMGAIFAAVYIGLYTRFSTQWGYLANLYNQIMCTYATLSPEQRDKNANLISWQAAFIEDAEDLHLATKPMFATIICQLLENPEIRETFLSSAIGGKERLVKLENKCRAAIPPFLNSND